jgi:Protein of unknown function (DUF1580)
MIDISSENILTFKQAADWIPRRRAGCKVSSSTFWRWSNIGIAGEKLETICLGGARCTSKQAIQRFFDAVTAARRGGSATPASPDAGRTRTEAERRRAAEKAGEVLETMIKNPPRRSGGNRKAATARLSQGA